MASKTREEKDRFFADLDRLDRLDDEDSQDEQIQNPVRDSEVKARSSKHSIGNRKSPQMTDDARPLPIPTHRVSDLPRPSTSDAAAPESVPSIPLRRTKSGNSAAPSTKRKGKRRHEEVVPEEDRIFDGLGFFFIPSSDDNPIRRVRIQRALARGATWARSWEEPVTHVIIDSELHIQRASRELKDNRLPEGIPVVKDVWLVECIKFRDLRDLGGTRFCVRGMISPFELEAKLLSTPSFCDAQRTSKSRGKPVSKTRTSQEAEKDSEVGEQQSTTRVHGLFHDDLVAAIQDVQKIGDLPASLLEDNVSFSSMPGSTVSVAEYADETPPARDNVGFKCMEKNDGEVDNPNARTIELLQQMATHYDQMGDHWRTRAYRMAISALRKQPTLIRTSKEAASLKGIGSRLADKIEEIVATDRLRRLENTMADPNDQLLRLFMGVYGAGFAQAQKWIAQGHRTLDDLQKEAALTSNQAIGIEHYDDFQQRIPRDEIERHAAIVREALRRADEGLEMIVGGSFRRGHKDSGDIDVIITKKDAGIEHLRTLVMGSVVPSLTRERFLKAALATSHSKEDGSKWHGAAALPGSSVWRRLDLLIVPWTELGAALIYFTGNDIFNRSIRLLAGRKGMRLNQHGLFKDVMRGRGRVKVTEGQLLEGHSERRIFELLGVPYRPPEHRKC